LKMLFFALLLTLSPLLSCETIQEVDSLIVVQHHVNLHRIKEHILAWGEDRGVGVFRSEVMNPLMSHLTVEVAMLASTLMEHMHLENVDRAMSSTPTQPANLEPVSTTGSSSGWRNGIQRVQRNIFGDIVSTITGMPTGEQYQHHMHVQEEIRKKLIHMAKHQVEAEQNMMRSVSELMTAEEQTAVRMTNLERLVEMQGTATARFFAYYHLLCEDRDMLEDTLEAVRGGYASTRLDVYLSRLAGLHTMGMFEYNQILQARGGFDVLYFARAYRQVEVRDYFLTNESAVLLTDERRYLMQPDGLPAYTHVLTEFEVMIFEILPNYRSLTSRDGIFWRVTN